MRKDVTRSLLLWPSIASAIIAGLWLLSSTNTPVWQLLCRQTKGAWHRAHGDDLIAPLLAFQLAFDEPMLTDSPKAITQPRVLHSEVPPPNPDVQIVERAEQGGSAMRVPERLAENFSNEVLFAPRIDEALETAGLVLTPSSDVIEVAPAFSNEFFADEKVADQVASVNADVELSSNAEVMPYARTKYRRSTSDAPMIVLLEVIDYGDDIAAGGNDSSDVAETDEPADKDVVEAVAPIDPSSSDLPIVNKPFRSALPSSIANLGDLAARHAVDTDDAAPAIATIEVDPSMKSARRGLEANPAGWPLTTRLNEELKLLASLAVRESPSNQTSHLVSIAPTAPLAAQWADQVADRLAQMQSLDRLGDPRASVLIDELEQLAADGFAQAENTIARYQQIQWLRTAYAVSRRVAVWKPVFRIVNSAPSTVKMFADSRSPESIQQRLDEIRGELDETGDVQGWTRFLLLDELSDVVTFDRIDQRNVIAKRFLSRLQWHGLDPAHKQWLDRESIHGLSEVVRPWVSEAVDYASLLAHLERKEIEATTLGQAEIVDAYQTLRFAEHSDVLTLAGALNTHYRNANVRIAVSKAMLQRLLPKVERQTMPIRTKLMGNRIRGISRVDSDVDIQFQPAEDRWSLTLQTKGNVSTQSVGRNGTTVFSTSRQSIFSTTTPIELTKRELRIGNSDVDVSGATRLREIRTNYDGWPLLGSLIQNAAESRFSEMTGVSNRIANHRMKTQLASGIHQRLNERFDARSNQFQQVVLGPLGSLRLDPLVVDLRTTEERLMARYRVAGDWQMGAFTPRPRAPSSSLMSLQVHQSAINNTLEQMVPREEPKRIDRMIVDSIVLFGQSEPQLPSDLPDDVEVQFAKTRPITVDIEDGLLCVTMRVVRLTKGERIKLTRFIVRATYRPELDGIHAYLVRDGHLRISGPGMSMRERLPVRAIFNKVLSPTARWPLTLPALVNHPNAQDLAVSQLELRDGWIGLAISQQDAPRIAIRPPAAE